MRHHRNLCDQKNRDRYGIRNRTHLFASLQAPADNRHDKEHSRKRKQFPPMQPEPIAETVVHTDRKEHASDPEDSDRSAIPHAVLPPHNLQFHFTARMLWIQWLIYRIKHAYFCNRKGNPVRVEKSGALWYNHYTYKKKGSRIWNANGKHRRSAPRASSCAR